MDSEAPFGVRVERNVLIPLNDGVSLAADLFLPDAPGSHPALVSYYPYHKDDLIGGLFDHPNRYFAARGYASLLVDLRGLGNSEGVAWDVGDPREGTDGAEIVEWAAAQPWCDGSVGMWGMSYGGITAFKTAAVRPAHLKAIVPMNACLDQYHDILYPGGCFNCLGIIGGWGPFMTTMNLAPPMYQDEGGRWYRVWRERLRQARAPYIMPDQEHPTYDDYWRQKSIEAERIEVPAFLMGAWRDIFPEAMVRAYERITAPRRLLMGPWMHEMPDLAGFERVDYLAEMLRWWDCWLKGIANGVTDEQPVAIYVQGLGWRTEREWPIARTRDETVYLAGADGAGTLTSVPSPGLAERSYRADPTVGVTAGLWDPTGTGLGAPLDQGPDELRSVTFTGEPLGGDLEVTGSPECSLFIALDEGDDLNLVVKLSDVSPDGHSALITTGWLKGSHRASHERPEPLPRGETLEFRVPLWATSYRIPAGHRLRVSVACADFPRVWPTRTNPLIRLATGMSRPSAVRLPTIPPATLPQRALPIPDANVARTPLDVEAKARWTIAADLAANSIEVSTGVRSVSVTPNRDGRFEIDRTGRARVSASRPDGARVHGEARINLQTPSGAIVVVEGKLRVTLTGEQFEGRVSVDGQVIFDQRWATDPPDPGAPAPSGATRGRPA
jgi:putative CocE/NonD family hydrolase